MRLVLHIVRKDLYAFLGPLGLVICLVLVLFLTSLVSLEFAGAAAAGVMFAGSFTLAQLCFTSERRRRTLELLLSLPLRPFHLALAKYCSVLAMCLILVNLPGAFLLGWNLLFITNALAIFIGVVCMTPAVVSAHPHAPDVPVFAAVGLMMLKLLAERWWPESVVFADSLPSHPYATGTAALLIAAVIVPSAALFFERKVLKN